MNDEYVKDLRNECLKALGTLMESKEFGTLTLARLSMLLHDGLKYHVGQVCINNADLSEK